MRALVRLAHGKAPDCDRCALGEAAVRQEFGCDGPVSMDYDAPPRPAVFWMSCGCGSGCDRCRKGLRPMYHCPRRLLEASTFGRGVERAFKMCTHYPLLPVTGGLADQSSTYLDALSVYRSETNAIEREEHEEHEKERKRQEMRAKRGRR